MKALKKAWSVGWRIAVCVLLLVWIFHTIFLNQGRMWSEAHNLQWAQMPRQQQWQLAWSKGPEDLWMTLSLVNLGALILSTALWGFGLWLGVVRWRLVLETQGLHLSLGRATWISLVAQFFNSFLLGSTGGDLIKAYYAARETHHLKTEAVTTVFVDRLVGLWAMLLFAGVMMLPNLDMIRHHVDFAVPCVLILGMLGTLTVVLWLAFWGGISRRFPQARHLLRRIPKGQLLERSIDSCRQFGKEKGLLFKSVIISLSLNVLWVVQVAVLGWGLKQQIPFFPLLVIVPIILCISSIPITPNGLGVREQLFVRLLGVLAIAGTAALSLSLLVGAEGLFWSLVGGVVYMTLRKKEHLSEVTHESLDENN